MTEKAYDDEIAPVLLELAEKCERLGLAMVSRVDWPGGYGITQKNVAATNVGLKLTQLAAHSNGNIDQLCMSALNHFDCSASAFLHSYTRTTPIEASNKPT